ncbi:CoA ester lyase [Nonomuraea sp. NPDC049486]|uniref:HpcH/HpaI aldolase/citrate lyase family protein n=1 Tax=Nonomuraea sp. NPDC049486 TaxID=3155773 RepID=UPI0034480B5B
MEPDHDRLCRAQSLLFVPGDRPDRFGKALAAGADAVIVDLEDAVRPADRPRARGHLADLLQRPQAAPVPVLVRVNDVGTGELAADVDSVVRAGLGGLVVPKLDPESAADTDRLISEAEQARGLAPGSIPVLGIVETAAGLLRLATLPRLPARVVRLAFGAGDFSADTGAAWLPGSPSLLAAKSMIVWISTALGLAPPVDTAFPWVSDLDGLRAESDQAAAVGYLGKFCIHPAQIETVHAALRPSDDQVRRAEAVVEALSASGAAGAQLLDGQLIDEAVVKWARRVLAIDGRPPHA